jgi:hypothetical protein
MLGRIGIQLTMSCSAHVLVEGEQALELLSGVHILPSGNIVCDFLALPESSGFVQRQLQSASIARSLRYFGILPGFTASPPSRIGKPGKVISSF